MHDEQARRTRRSTRALLTCGALGAPLFLALFHIDMATRPGYDVLRHAPSLLMTGDRGWLQIANFVITGLAMIACAVGVRQVLHPGRGATWGPRLMAVYGVAMICTGIFVTGPQMGYPPGTPSDRLPGVNAPLSWQESAHTLSVFVMYAALTAACFVLARRFAKEPGGWWWAASCMVTGVAAPAVLLTGTLILDGARSADWYPLVDGLLGRAIIPLGWIWAMLVPLRILLTPTPTSAVPSSATARAAEVSR
jgi:Protein of unknown function (DUF998)